MPLPAPQEPKKNGKQALGRSRGGFSCKIHITVPTIVSNPAFASVTAAYQSDLHIPHPDDTVTLKNQIEYLLTLSDSDRAEIELSLRKNIIAQHSLDALVQKLVQILETGE